MIKYGDVAKQIAEDEGIARMPYKLLDGIKHVL